MRTHCKRGHEMVAPNLYIRPDGGRRCRECQRIRQHANDGRINKLRPFAVEERELLFEVPTEPLRERFLELEAKGLTAAKVARTMGWLDGRNDMGDGSRVKKALGILITQQKDGNVGHRQYVKYDTAVLLVKGMGLDPHECGV